jgi:hypothetical protein
LLLAVTVILFGCSSSSTVRYGSEQEKIDSDGSSIRFTSEDDTLVVDLNLDLKDPSDLPEDEPDVELSDLLTSGSIIENPSYFDKENSTAKERMLMEIIKYLDTPYKYGGTTKSGIDCSAFTKTMYKNVLSFDLERTARHQFKQGDKVEELQFGDLVFFNTRKRVKPGHVGIYIGDNLFAHASSTKGVTISSLEHNYYAGRFMGARRFDENDKFKNE